MQASAEITAELREREPVFQGGPPGADRSYFEAIAADDFEQIGASGLIYPRERMVDMAVDRHERGEAGQGLEVEDFTVREVGAHVFLASYTLHQPDGNLRRSSRRTTIWSNASGNWQVLHHQGTMVAGA